MGRRTKEDRERVEWWPDKLDLFADPKGNRFPDEWVGWLRTSAPAECLRRLDELVASGCDRPDLVKLLMELHVAQYLAPFSRRELESAVTALSRAEAWLARLSKSDQQFDLFLSGLPGEVSPAKFEHVPGDLAEIRQRLAVLARASSLRESRWLNRLLGSLVRYVRWATAQFRDEALTELVAAILHNPKFSMPIWRRNHKRLWSGPSNLEEGWNQAVSEGRRQPPTVENATKRRQGHRVMSEAHRAKGRIKG